MRNFSILTLAFATAACTQALPVDSRAAAEPVIAVERAFAARHQQVSVKKSFLEYAAPDGVMVTPGGVRNAREFIATWPNDDDTGFIKWWPNFAGIARSGDLGFTTGPASFDGGKRFTNYFTIWKKQPDGSWKWAIDLGTRKGVAPAGGPDEPVAVVPVSGASAKPAAAWAELLALDTELGLASGRAAIALAPRFAPEARAIGWDDSPAIGAAAIAASLAKRPPIAMKPEGGGVSAAGDLGWTYGFASWTEGGQAKRGPYLRAWQRRAGGWMILVDNVHAF
jgi:ketosteroid isomerase-like protein